MSKRVSAKSDAPSGKRRRTPAEDVASAVGAGNPALAGKFVAAYAANADVRAADAMWAQATREMTMDPCVAQAAAYVKEAAKTTTGKAHAAATQLLKDATAAAAAASKAACTALATELGDAKDTASLQKALGGVGVVTEAEQRGTKEFKVQLSATACAGALKNADGAYVPSEAAVRVACGAIVDKGAKVYDVTKPPVPEPAAVVLSQKKTARVVTSAAFKKELAKAVNAHGASTLDKVLPALVEDEEDRKRFREAFGAHSVDAKTVGQWVDTARTDYVPSMTSGVRGGAARIAAPGKPAKEPSKSVLAVLAHPLFTNHDVELDAAAAHANSTIAAVAGGVDALVPCDATELARAWGMPPPPTERPPSPAWAPGGTSPAPDAYADEDADALVEAQAVTEAAVAGTAAVVKEVIAADDDSDVDTEPYTTADTEDGPGTFERSFTVTDEGDTTPLEFDVFIGPVDAFADAKKVNLASTVVGPRNIARHIVSKIRRTLNVDVLPRARFANVKKGGNPAALKPVSLGALNALAVRLEATLQGAKERGKLQQTQRVAFEGAPWALVSITLQIVRKGKLRTDVVVTSKLLDDFDDAEFGVTPQYWFLEA